MRLEQHQRHAPFVVQRRDDLGLGSCLLTSHADPTRTTFTVVAIQDRGEMGFTCQVVRVSDDRDGVEYVIDTGIMGPGLPGDVFNVIV